MISFRNFSNYIDTAFLKAWKNINKMSNHIKSLFNHLTTAAATTINHYNNNQISSLKKADLDGLRLNSINELELFAKNIAK